MANPGPATTVTSNTQATFAPIQTPIVNTQAGPTQGLNGFRLLAVARGVSLATLGDAAIMPVINSLSFSVFQVVVTNAQLAGVSGSIATAAFGVFTAAAAAGTAIVANAASAANTSATVVRQAAIASTATVNAVTNPNLFLNVGTALATATCDVFVYGFDVS